MNAGWVNVVITLPGISIQFYFISIKHHFTILIYNITSIQGLFIRCFTHHLIFLANTRPTLFYHYPVFLTNTRPMLFYHHTKAADFFPKCKNNYCTLVWFSARSVLNIQPISVCYISNERKLFFKGAYDDF